MNNPNRRSLAHQEDADVVDWLGASAYLLQK
jgi:hypothetical protein